MLEQERRQLEKLEEEKRFKEQEAARLLEIEWLEKERQALLEKQRQMLDELEASRIVGKGVVEKVVAEEKPAVKEAEIAPIIKNAACIGPTARFKANCR